MALALVEEADFESGLARRYMNVNWFRLAPLFLAVPVLLVLGAVMPMGMVLLWVSLLVMFDVSLSVCTRALMVPEGLAPHARPTERGAQVITALAPIATLGLPLVTYSLYLFALGLF